MAELRFFFGTMGSGKSTQALQIHHNLTKSGLSCVLITQLDRREGVVSSRLGVAAEATVIDGTVDLHRLVAQEHATRSEGIHAVICDEAQFYQAGQIDQLARLVDELDIEVYAFGLLTSFQGRLFPGSQRLLEVADQRSQLQVEARCWCGARATHNARLVNGVQVYEGDLKVVGDTGGGEEAPERKVTVTYDLRCRRHWLAGKLESAQDSLFADAPLADGSPREAPIAVVE
jgi:thymidine kinase